NKRGDVYVPYGYNGAAVFGSAYLGGDLVLATAPAPARPRPGGGRLFIIVGLLLAVLAGAGVFFLGGTLGGGGGSGPSINVVVAATAIPQRASIRTEDLQVEKVSGV